MYRDLKLVAFVVVLVSTATGQAQSSSDADVPQDTAIVELTLPEGASFKLNDQQYRASKAGEKRVLPLRPFPPGRSFPYELEVQFSDGSITQKTLALRGGERVRVPILSPHVQRPEFVLQTGFASTVMSGAFTPDGNSVVIGSCEKVFAIYDIATGRQLRRFKPILHPACTPFVPIAVSPDSRLMATTSWEEGTILWDIETGEQLRSFPDAISSMAFSPDGKWLAFCLDASSDSRELAIWNISDGTKRVALQNLTAAAKSISFSPDGRLLLVGFDDKTAMLWDVETRQPGMVLVGHSGAVTSVAFRHDGQQILTASNDGTVILRETNTGQPLRTLQAQQGRGEEFRFGIRTAKFCHDGSRIITTGISSTAVLWDVESGEILRTFDLGRPLAMSPDARRILTIEQDIMSWNSTVWDLETGARLQTFSTKTDTLESISCRPDGQRLFTRAAWRHAVVWNLETGMRQTVIAGQDIQFSQDGRRVLTRSEPENTEPPLTTPVIVSDAETGKTIKIFRDIDRLDGVENPDGRRFEFVTTNGSRFLMSDRTTSTVWDIESGKPTTINGNAPVFSPDGQLYVVSVNKTKSRIQRWGEPKAADGKVINVGWWNIRTRPVFSSDGQILAARDSSGFVAIWDSTSGEKLQTFEDSKATQHWRLSPDGRRLAGIDWEQHTVRLWDTNTGAELKKWSGVSANFSPDGQQMFIGGFQEDGLAIRTDRSASAIYDTYSGVKVQSINAGDDRTFSPSGRQLMTQSDEWTTEFWDTATGDKVAELLSLNEAKDWLVFTPEGLFDGSEGGRQQVAFRIGGGLNVVPVDRFFNDFYTPGLLAMIANGERPMPSIELGHELPPKIRIVAPQSGGIFEESSVTLVIEATDQGGGVRGPWVRHNGARLLTEGQTEQTGATIRMTLDVQLVEGENRIEVESATNNEFATVDSTKAVLVLRYEKPLHKPHLHVLAVGTNYADPSLRLRFARQDAESIGTLFQTRGQTLYDKVHVHLLLDEQVTKESIQDMLTRKDGDEATIADTARPQDSLLVLFGGHGTIVGQRYFFIPHAFKRESADLEADIKNQGLAADVLGDWLASVPCLKRMLIFDTCASGAALDLVRTSRNPFALRGVIERLNRTQGVFTIAASAATDEAKEVSELGHGVLTYTLLAGLGAVHEGPLDGQRIETRGPERVVSVMDWFGYADDHVPILMQKYFGQTQDIQFSGQGTSFPVLTLED